ncbi:uncharacterized protein Grip163 [Drosophila virilis]|uniref:Gamma-tubulin complex component 6 n=1 Tax=Drosophila virilis TaxID=7244 RepID=B4LE00_DROVI|nr:gamma-tubulin complex component 6 [Drosophila virilis]EDW70043.1 uncharacterized protein Dvir_GJ13579 [Drosophila virilis]
MEAARNSNESVFNIVTKIAELLSQDERAQAEQAAAAAEMPSPASVANKRTKIYESLLSPRSANPSPPRLDRLPECQKLLDEQCANLNSTLGNEIPSCLLNICSAQEEQKQQPESSKSCVYWQNKILLARPLRLLPNPCQDWQFPGRPQGPPLLRSVENMRDSIKPIEFRRQSEFQVSDLDVMRSAQKSQKKTILACSVLKDSMSRINESRRGPRRVKINLPLRDKGQVSAKESDPNKGLTLTITSEKHFVTDKLVSNELKWHQDQTLQLMYIKLPLLIDHLKQAAAGLQSDTIVCTDDGNFMLKPHITLSVVLPEVLAEFAEPFLASGRAYRRLSARTQWQHAPNRIERPLNRTMRQAIITFLTNSRLFLLSLSVNNLPQLLRGAGPAMEMLQQMDQMFQAEPSLNNAEGMNGMCGMSLLSFVWSAINVGINCEFSQLLMYLLRSLCGTYFAQLQRWLYQGELEEPFNELFIKCCPHKMMHERSKEFFDKGYYVRTDIVPGFLAGCEQAILQCGKYNRFLKTYNPQHAVFNLKYPDLIVCLSEQQLMKMRKELELHYEQILQNIQPFKMQSILAEQTESSRRFGNRMWDCTQSHIAAWEQRQRDLQLKANAVKQKRYEELNEQREQQEQLRMEQRRLGLVFELGYQRKCEQLEEMRLKQEKEGLEEQIAALKKATAPIQMTVADTSPDDSTSSGRSYVSCEELDPEELAKVKPESVTTRPDQADVLNSNETDMEMARNRMRNNSSEQFQECQMEVQLQKDVTTTSVGNYTEVERNRMRVLNCTVQRTKLPPDLNMNLEDLTDLQRNRQRMQQHNTFGSLNSEEDAASESEKRLLHSDTELARNRRHVMEGDFTISGGLGNAMHLPLEPHKLCVESTLGTETPMSTTSDVEIEVDIPNELVDAANNNSINSSANCDTNLDNEDRTAAAAVVEPEAVALKREPVFSLPTLQLDTSQANGAEQIQKIGHNPFIIKRYMQLSVMIPLKSHLSLLRNEVLRIFHEQHVFEHFCQLRKYFFLLDGEFGTLLIVGILEQIESGVVPHSLCQKGVLDAILNNALINRAADGTGAAVVADNLALNCTNIPEAFDLMDINVLSIFKLDCKMEWPLNLVFSGETMDKYAQIFSHLIKLRHVSFIMERAYLDFQQSSRLHGRPLQQSSQYRHLQMVRHKLSHFVITLQNHLVTNALEGTWKSFTDELITVDSVEGLYQRHVEYLKEIAFFSLLNRRSAKFRETIDNILVIALRFCKILNSKPFVLDDEQQFVHPRYKRLVYEEAEFEKFIRYAIYLGNKVAASGYQEKIVDLIRIINYNNYYNVADSTN